MPKASDLIDKLTDVYNKKPDSNIGKLCAIVAGQLQLVEDTLNQIQDWRQINFAEGATLDRIGENVVQTRGAATDEVYRVLLKSKIARNLSKTDINTIIRVLSVALDADPSDIRINEMFSDPQAPEPAAISVTQVPIERLLNIGLGLEQFGQIVQKTVAAGVRVGVIELSGTFAFADGTGEQLDDAAGFSDEAGQIGGYFGAAYSSPDAGTLAI